MNDQDRTRLFALRETGHVERAHCTPHHGSYSLAAHCWQVETLLLLLHPNPSRELLIAAHWHDAPERWTGDLPGPVKWLDGPELEAALSRLEEKIRELHGIHISLTERERLWLKTADRLELLLWTMDQRALGNLHVQPMITKLGELFLSSWDNLPGPVQKFLDRHPSRMPDREWYLALKWQRTPDDGWWTNDERQDGALS